MPDWEQRLFSAAAVELTLRGFAHADVDQIAESAGIGRDAFCDRFPDKRSLMLALIDEIASFHRNSILEELEGLQNPTERLVQFITTSLSFVERYPAYAQIIVIALFSNDDEIKNRVYETYENVFNLIIDDFMDIGIIKSKSPALLSDLSTILLSFIFTGGCPHILLEYSSWLDPKRVSMSILDGLRRHYLTSNGKGRFI